MNKFLALCCVAGLASQLHACDGLSTVGYVPEVAAPEASYLLVRTSEGCPELADPETAAAVFASLLEEEESDALGVAKVRVIEECSGAGGTHVMSSTSAEGYRFWLGSHACYIDEPSPDFREGIIVGIGSQTAAWFQGDEGWCMQYPGEEEVFATSISTDAMAWFGTDEEAGAFLEAVERQTVTN